MIKAEFPPASPAVNANSVGWTAFCDAAREVAAFVQSTAPEHFRNREHAEGDLNDGRNDPEGDAARILIDEPEDEIR